MPATWYPSPVFDASMTLDRLVTNLFELGQVAVRQVVAGGERADQARVPVDGAAVAKLADRALVNNFEGSLDFIAPTLTAATTDGSLGGDWKAASNVATFMVIEDFIHGRGDLSEAERTHLRGALGYLAQATPFIVQRQG